MFTLNTTEVHAVCYGIGAYNSKGMLSNNPNAGIRETDTSRTLDLNGGNPACNQGGIVVVEMENDRDTETILKRECDGNGNLSMS